MSSTSGDVSSVRSSLGGLSFQFNSTVTVALLILCPSAPLSLPIDTLIDIDLKPHIRFADAVTVDKRSASAMSSISLNQVQVRLSSSVRNFRPRV